MRAFFVRAKETITAFVKRRKIVLVAILILLALVGTFGAGQYLGQHSQDSRMMQLLSENQHLHTEIITVSNKHQSAVKAISQLSDEKTHLVELVAKLQKQADKPPVIREVIVTRTVVQPAEPAVTVSTLPDEYRFKLEPGLEVARFAHDGDNYTFTTRQLDIRASVVVGENQSAGLLQIASDAEPDKFYDVPINDLKVRITDPATKIFKPQLMLGVRAGLSAHPQLTAQAMLTLVHPTKCIDTVGIVVAGNTETAQFGVSPFAYNIGCNLPVVDDLWITTDAYVDIHAQFGAGVGIGSKF